MTIRERADLLRLALPAGTRVRILHWGPSDIIDDNATVPPGTEGSVSFIDDYGTIGVDWDNGAKLGIVSGHDRYEVVR